VFGFHVLANDSQNAPTIRFSGQSNVEATDFQLEETGEQLGIVHIRTVGRVAISSWTRMNAQAFAFVTRESREAQVVQVDEAMQ
jgi:hypothetical protein